MEELVIVKKEKLVTIADKIREKTGKTEQLDFEQFETEIKSIVGGGDFEGVENGYDITFYDEYQNGLAFYSIKQGHSINAPVYNCKSWQTDKGVGVMFPYQPTEDIIIIANNDTWASKFYGFYNIDPMVYPVMLVLVTNGGDYGGAGATLYFAKTYSKNYQSTSNDSTARYYLRLLNYYAASTSKCNKDSSWEEIYANITTDNPTIKLSSDTIFKDEYYHSIIYYANDKPTYYLNPTYYTVVKMEE